MDKNQKRAIPRTDTTARIGIAIIEISPAPNTFQSEITAPYTNAAGTKKSKRNTLKRVRAIQPNKKARFRTPCKNSSFSTVSIANGLIPNLSVSICGDIFSMVSLIMKNVLGSLDASADTYTLPIHQVETIRKSKHKNTAMKMR